MKCIIHVEMLESDPEHQANLYVIRFDGEEKSEYEKFCDVYENITELEWDFNVIEEWLNRICMDGAEESFLKAEQNPIKALPINIGAKLRLYCFKIDKGILIVGGGGVKERNVDPKKNRLQDYPELYKHWRLVKFVGQNVSRLLTAGKIEREVNILSEMTFQIDL